LCLPRDAGRAPDAGKLVHRRVADLALDRVAVVLHREPERQAFGVVSNNFATRQRHRKFPLAPLSRVLCDSGFVEGTAVRRIIEGRYTSPPGLPFDELDDSSSGASSTPQPLDRTPALLEYRITRLRG
jgi:hypothetical protein